MTDIAGYRELIERLRSNSAHLRKMMANVAFGGDGLQISIREPDTLLEDLDAAASATAALSLPAEQGWLPISSAPKDGTRILLYNWSGRSVIGYWGDLHLCRQTNGRTEQMFGWRDDGSGFQDVTHWMPLPSPPLREE